MRTVHIYLQHTHATAIQHPYNTCTYMLFLCCHQITPHNQLAVTQFSFIPLKPVYTAKVEFSLGYSTLIVCVCVCSLF